VLALILLDTSQVQPDVPASIQWLIYWKGMQYVVG